MVLADYNDKNYDYTKYWQNRDYENKSEFIALEKLLPEDFNKDGSVIDVGGGFGRLLPILNSRFGKITIFDYSQKLLDTAEENAKSLGVEIKTIKGDINIISNPTTEKYDCVVMLRVSHHLDDLEKVFGEIKKILNGRGIFILEIANKIHFKSSFINILKGNFKYFSKESVKSGTFLNHHPKNVEFLLNKTGFEIERKLSVSNFRHPFLKRIFPIKFIIFLETITQGIGSIIYFGPSIFYQLKLKDEK